LRIAALTVLLSLILFGCGGLRYSQVTPEAKDFHPKNIGILPIDVSTSEEAKGVIDKIVADELVDKGWFSSVVSTEMFHQRMASDDDIKKTVLDYSSKLKTVSYSDPDLSKKIGEQFKIDAFLVIDIDYWNYTVINDKKLAKVEASVQMIDANTGKLCWKARHHVIKDYLLLKPALSDVARNLVDTMISEMPH